MSAEKASVYQFGVFEFDSHTAELRKGGIKLKLQEQQRQVLVRLLEHPDEIVSRDELRSLLWSENTFVDFETGLNTAIKRLRDTLGDSAENPTFIETVPRKGYRFIAPVELLPRASGFKPAPASQPAKPRRDYLRIIGYVVLFSALFAVGAWFWRSLPRLPRVANVVQLTNDAKSKGFRTLPVTDGVHLYFVQSGFWLRNCSNIRCRRRGHSTPDPAPRDNRNLRHLPKFLRIVSRQWDWSAAGSCHRKGRGCT